MSAIRLSKVSAAILLPCCIGMQPQSVYAETYLKPDKFLFGEWAGPGHVSMDANNSTGRAENALALGFRAGYAATSRYSSIISRWTIRRFLSPALREEPHTPTTARQSAGATTADRGLSEPAMNIRSPGN